MTWLPHRARLLAALAMLTQVSIVQAQVSHERILRAERTPEEWLTYNGAFSAQRHSPLAQITPANVKDLELQWVFQARSLEKFEASPLVVNGIVYTVQAPDRDDILNVGGFSDAVFQVVGAFLAHDANRFVTEVEAIDLG